MKCILILGGAGFVGANLAIYLNQIGHRVTVVDNLVRRGSELNLKEFRKKSIRFIHGDIRNPEDFSKFGKHEVVLLCAAQPSATNYSNPTFDITNNTIGVLNTLNYCMSYGAGLIFWSTNKVYSAEHVNSDNLREEATRYLFKDLSFIGYNESTPVDGAQHSIYGVSKIMADLLCQEWANAFSIPCIINRFSCLTGIRQWGLPEQGWFSWFAIAKEFNLPIEIFGFNGKQVRDCLYITDLQELISKQIDALGNKQYYGEVFNVGGGIKNTISIIEAVNYLDKKKHTLYHDQARRADHAIYISDITKVSNEFNWKPKVDPYQSYEEILEWVRSNKKKLRKLYT